jgi:copper chaperone CopZ
MSTVVMNVPDISCEHCERTITNALSAVNGIDAVRVSIPAKQVHVSYNPDLVSTDRMREVLAEEDYPVAE